MTSTTAARIIAIKDAAAARVKAGSIGTRRVSTASRICTDDEENPVPNAHSAGFGRATGCLHGVTSTFPESAADF
jgi:hypothetical protein